MRYYEVSARFEVDDSTEPQDFLEALGEWAERRDWSAEVRLQEVKPAPQKGRQRE